jgi:hypothetical protein
VVFRYFGTVRSPRPVLDNYLEELVRIGLIADNNVMLIEALHLGAHRGTVSGGGGGALCSGVFQPRAALPLPGYAECRLSTEALSVLVH